MNSKVKTDAEITRDSVWDVEPAAVQRVVDNIPLTGQRSSSVDLLYL